MALHPRRGKGGKFVAKPLGKDVRSLIRRHLREAGKTVKRDLALWWEMKPGSAERRMYDHGRVLASTHIDAVVKKLKLDDFDAQELYRLAAIEAGYKINLLPNIF